MLTDGRYAIVAVQQNHIEAIRCWRNAQMDVLRQSHEITAEQQQNYFASTIWSELESTQPRNILLTFLKDDQPIGYGGLVHIAWEHSRAEISFLLDPAYLQPEQEYRELFLIFLGLMQRLAFEDLNLNRLYTETYSMRFHHIAVLEAFGFAREGTLKEHVYIQGRPIDSIMHGLLKA